MFRAAIFLRFRSDPISSSSSLSAIWISGKYFLENFHFFNFEQKKSFWHACHSKDTNPLSSADKDPTVYFMVFNVKKFRVLLNMFECITMQLKNTPFSKKRYFHRWIQCVSNMMTPIRIRNSLKINSTPSLRGNAYETPTHWGGRVYYQRISGQNGCHHI